MAITKLTFANISASGYKTLQFETTLTDQNTTNIALTISTNSDGSAGKTINLDSLASTYIQSWFTGTPTKTAYLLSDLSNTNFYIVAVNANATNALSLTPQFISISPTTSTSTTFNATGTGALDFGALNYGLINQASLNYVETDGQLKSATTTAVIEYTDTGVLLQASAPASLSGAGVNTVAFTLFKASYQTDADTTVDLGYVLAKSEDGAPVTGSNIFYLNQKISPDQFSSNPPSLYTNEQTKQLVLIWDSNNTSYSDPLYALVTANSPTPVFDRLTPDKQMQLETSMKVCLSNEVTRPPGFLKLVSMTGAQSIAPIKIAVETKTLVAGAVTTTPKEVALYRLSNGDFVTLNATKPVPTTANGYLVSLDGKSSGNTPSYKYSDFTLVTPSQLRVFETTQLAKIGTKTYSIYDLNGDGVIGTAVDKALLTNDNFAIYKTTAGDLVYSANNQLSAGDKVTDAVTLNLTWQEQKLLELAKTVVSNISITTGQSVTNTLYIAGLEQDDITGAATLRELALTLSGNEYGSATVNNFYFNNSTAQRISFLERENFYNYDLNNDGVIGDTITAQLSGNDLAATYQTASGTVYVSKNLGLNIGDAKDSTAIWAFDLSNAPDRIDTAVFTSDKTVDIYYTDIKTSGDAHYKRSFIVNSGVLSPANTSITNLYDPKLSLSQIDLLQAEVKYKVDISGDASIGDTIYSVKYGLNNTSTYHESTSQDVGIYALTSEINTAREHVLIAAKGAGYVGNTTVGGDIQPNTDVYFLKNGASSSNLYWQVPTGREIVAAGIFDDLTNTVDIVTKANNQAQYFLNTFDATGTTLKPKGTLLSQFALYNEEVKLQTDFVVNKSTLTTDGQIGDSVTALASSDSYGVYMLAHSGAIVLSKEGTWVDSESSTGVQGSLNFVSLKNSNGSTWLPFGYKTSVDSNGIYQIDRQDTTVKIKQVVFNLDGTQEVYVQRTTDGPTGAVNTIYDVSFNANGVTKNSIGVALKPSALFAKELDSDIDINGDGYVGKPFLGVNTTHMTTGTRIPQIAQSGNTASFVTGKLNGEVGVLYGNQLAYGSVNQIKSKAIFYGTDPVNDSYSYDFDVSNVLSEALISSSFTKVPFLVAYTMGKIKVLANNTHTALQVIKTDGAARDVATTADFNADGNMDFVSASYKSIQIYKGNGHGNFVPSQNLSLPHTSGVVAGTLQPQKTAVGLFDANTSTDLAVLTQNELATGNDFFTLYANSKTGLKLVDSFSLNESGNTWMISADLNKDKTSDIVIGNLEKNQITVALSSLGVLTKDHDFVNSFTLSGIYNPSKGFIDDINGDGNKDIVLLDTDSEGAAQVEAFISDGKGGFSSAQKLFDSDSLLYSGNMAVQASSPGAMSIKDIALADLNGDGLSDFVIKAKPTADGYSGNSFQVVWNLSNAISSTTKVSSTLTHDGGNFYSPSFWSQSPASVAINYEELTNSLESLGLQSSLESINGSAKYIYHVGFFQGYQVKSDESYSSNNSIEFSLSNGSDIKFNIGGNVAIIDTLSDDVNELLISNTMDRSLNELLNNKTYVLKVKPGDYVIDISQYSKEDSIEIDSKTDVKVIGDPTITQISPNDGNVTMDITTSKGHTVIHLVGVNIDELNWSIV